MIRALLLDDSATTAVEYAFIASFIAGLIIVVAYVLGGKVNGLFQSASKWGE
jgi:Flp pilus assembly pilin Flp